MAHKLKSKTGGRQRWNKEDKLENLEPENMHLPNMLCSGADPPPLCGRCQLTRCLPGVEEIPVASSKAKQ